MTFLRDVIHRGMNRWLFQEITASSSSQQGNDVQMTLQVGYWVAGAPEDKRQHATVEMTFALAGWKGNEQVYRCARVALSGYDGAFADQLETRVKEILADGIGIARFDPSQVASNAVVALKYVLPGEYWLREHQVVDGGLFVKLNIGMDNYRDEGWKALELTLDLEATGDPESSYWFTCDSIEMNASNGDKWFPVEGPQKLRDALKGVAIAAGASSVKARDPGPARLTTGAFFATEGLVYEDA
jgi:hypothetical protein